MIGEEAIKKYQHVYNDSQFRRLEMTIVAEVCGHTQLRSERSIELGKKATADLLNLVIRCAEYLCGFEYIDPFVELRKEMVKIKQPELVDDICQYLRPYVQGNYEVLEKFRETTLTAMLLDKVESQLDAIDEQAGERPRMLRVAALEATDDLIATIRRLIDIARSLLLDA